MRREIFNPKCAIIVVCGRRGSGKSAVIARILKRENLSASWMDITSLKIIEGSKGIKRHLVITGIQTLDSLRETLASFLASSLPLSTLVCEVTLSSPLARHFLEYGHLRDISVLYTKSPWDFTLSLPPSVLPVTLDVSRNVDWQVSAHALRAYLATPDTFSALSTFSPYTLPLLSEREVMGTLAECFPGYNTRTLSYVVRMMRFVVDRTLHRIQDIRRDFGTILDVYTMNVGLMLSDQIEQVQRMFSADLDLSQMFVVFPEVAIPWQMVECNRTAVSLSPCQRHIKKLLTCNENFYKHTDINLRFENRDYKTITESLLRIMGSDKKLESLFQSHEALRVTNVPFSEQMIISPGIFILLVQIIYRVRLNIPVILCGKSGSGKSALIRYTQYLYTQCDSSCVIVSHDPLLQSEAELRRRLDGISAEVVLVSVKVTSSDSLDDVMKMIFSRRIHGSDPSPDRMKFVVEISAGIHESAVNKHIILPVSVDMDVVRHLMSRFSIPDHVHNVVSKFLADEIISYRNINSLIKVHSWVSQVLIPRYAAEISSTFHISPDNGDSAIALLISLQAVFGLGPENITAVLESVENSLNLGSSVGKFVESYTNYLSGVVQSWTKIDGNRVLYLAVPLLICVETGLPLVINRSDINQIVSMTKRVNSRNAVSGHAPGCRTRVIDSDATPEEIVMCYTECLNEQILTAKRMNIFQRGVIVCTSYEDLEPCSRSTLAHLISRRSLSTNTPVISVVVGLNGQQVPGELLGCIIGPGLVVTRDTHESRGHEEKESRDSVPVDERGELVSDKTRQLDDQDTMGIEAPCDDNKVKGAGTAYSAILKWVKKKLGCKDLQSIENGVLVTNWFLSNCGPVLYEGACVKTLNDNLEKFHTEYGEVFPYFVKIPTSTMKDKLTDHRQMPFSKLSDTLIEARVNAIVLTRGEMKWSNAPSYTAELTTLASQHSTLSTLYFSPLTPCSHDTCTDMGLYTCKMIKCLLWFCELSSVWCGLRDADLKQFLKVCHVLLSGEPCNYSLLTSWVVSDTTHHPGLLAHYLMLVMREWCQGTRLDTSCHRDTLLALVAEVVPLVSSVQLSELLLRSIAKCYGVESLNYLYSKAMRNRQYTNTVYLSALVLVYKKWITDQDTPILDTKATLPIHSIVSLRSALEKCVAQLVELHIKRDPTLESEDLLRKYFGEKGESHTFSVFSTLTREHGSIASFVLRLILEDGGVDCCKAMMSITLPHLAHHSDLDTAVDRVCSTVLSGYTELRAKVLPICTLCDGGREGDGKNTSLQETISPGVAAVVDYEKKLKTVNRSHFEMTPGCGCLKNLTPVHLTPVIETTISPKYRYNSHAKVAVYLAGNVSPDGNAFQQYFHRLLTAPDISTMYWMGMPHDDIYEMMNTVKPSEKFEGVEKAYEFYQCPNGHVYTINNCGDPLQRSTCPACKSLIGGHGHIPVRHNRKINKNSKKMLETGYTLKPASGTPGKTSVRSLSQLSTAVIWYISHLILTVRSHHLLPETSNRLVSDFTSISKLLDITVDETTAFLFDLITRMCAADTSTISYTVELVQDSLEPLDILISNRNEELKSERKKWESEFDKIVDEVKTSCVPGYGELLKHDGQEFSESTDSSETMDEDRRIESIDHPCYWAVKVKKRQLPTQHPFIRKLQEVRDKVPLISHLPYLLDLTARLKDQYNFILDTSSLTATPSSLGLDITPWHEIWCQVDSVWSRSDLIYPACDLIPLEHVVLRDVIPTTASADTGATTLNMIRFLSKLHNSILPDSTRESPRVTPLRVFDPETLHRLSVCLECDDSRHVDSLVETICLSPLRKLPTERAAVLEDMRIRTLYSSRDLDSFVEFHSSTSHDVLQTFEKQLVSQVSGSDIIKLHRILTAVIVIKSEQNELSIEVTSLLKSLTSRYPNLDMLINERSKLFQLYRHVNVEVYRRSHLSPAKLGEECPQFLRSFFECEIYNRSRSFSIMGGAVEEVACLIAEFVTLFIAPFEKPENLSGWQLIEALDCYLDRFKGRDSTDLSVIDPVCEIDDINSLLTSLFEFDRS